MNEYRQITEAFQENFRNYGELGASVSVWKEGREIVSLHSGFAAADETHPWTEHSLVPVYSATKGAASATLLLALHQQGASPQMSMGELWPFPGRQAYLTMRIACAPWRKPFRRGSRRNTATIRILTG